MLRSVPILTYLRNPCVKKCSNPHLPEGPMLRGGRPNPHLPEGIPVDNCANPYLPDGVHSELCAKNPPLPEEVCVEPVLLEPAGEEPDVSLPLGHPQLVGLAHHVAG